eukprot:SAG11_NODE_6674_length_1270_cov_0.831768_3_plen_74_part_00
MALEFKLNCAQSKDKVLVIVGYLGSVEIDLVFDRAACRLCLPILRVLIHFFCCACFYLGDRDGCGLLLVIHYL